MYMYWLFHEHVLDMRWEIANKARSTKLAIIISSNKREWNNYFIKNSHKISIKIKVLTLFCKSNRMKMYKWLGSLMVVHKEKGHPFNA